MTIFNFFSRNSSRDISRMAEAIRKAFKTVKAELDDHLDAVNQNTAEIQANQGLLAELEAKIEKLTERMDNMELLINPDRSRMLGVKLTRREQEVFMSLYLSKGLSIKDIGKRLGFTEEMVEMYVFNLLSKGIPIQKELVDDIVVFSLEPDFKDLQARRNLLDIDPRVSKQLAVHGA